jgi:hypothetical protein
VRGSGAVQEIYAKSAVDSSNESFHTPTVSSRLQVSMPDDEYQAVVRAAQERNVPVAQLVRESLRRTLAEIEPRDPEEQIARVLRFARFEGPTGEIESVLAEIEQGRDASTEQKRDPG